MKADYLVVDTRKNVVLLKLCHCPLSSHEFLLSHFSNRNGVDLVDFCFFRPRVQGGYLSSRTNASLFSYSQSETVSFVLFKSSFATIS